MAEHDARIAAPEAQLSAARRLVRDTVTEMDKRCPAPRPPASLAEEPSGDASFGPLEAARPPWHTGPWPVHNLAHPETGNAMAERRSLVDAWNQRVRAEFLQNRVLQVRPADEEANLQDPLRGHQIPLSADARDREDADIIDFAAA